MENSNFKEKFSSEANAEMGGMIETQIDALTNSQVSILNEEFLRGDSILEDIEKLYETSSPDEQDIFYSSLLNLLTNSEFNEDEAKLHWENILKKFQSLRNIINRKISLRIAIIDYFTTDFKIYKNPTIIEILLYEIAKKNSYIDELTGLYNFRYLKNILFEESNRSKRYNLKYSIVFIDMDNLKDINDKFGHIEGGEAMKRLAHSSRAIMRMEDVLCRYGGDEFVYLLPQTDSKGALECINRIRNKISEDFQNLPYRVTISAGIAEYPADSVDTSKLIEMADKAMYQAKHRGKDCVVVYHKKA